MWTSPPPTPWMLKAAKRQRSALGHDKPRRPTKQEDQPRDKPWRPVVQAKSAKSLTILGPLVLASDVLLLFRCEVIGDVKRLTDLLRRLALDHVRNSLATNVKKRLDIEVVGRLYGVSLELIGRQGRFE